MPTLDDIEIAQIFEVRCPTHGKVGTAANALRARALQRHHFEWRHQPNPEDRLCGWRYPTGGWEPGYQVCVLDAGHLALDHRDEHGNTWTDLGSKPRADVEELYR